MTKNKKQNNKGEVVIYKSKDGKASLEVKLREETVWLDAHQIASLFQVDRTGVVRHIHNIYRSRELDKRSTCAKIAQVAKDGKVREMDFYNLDMIISVGYRVNSKRATQFRIWATRILKKHLIKGYTINQKRLREKGLSDLEQAVALIKKTTETRQLTSKEAKGLLKVITDYAYSWLLLQKFDERSLEIGKTTKGIYQLDYDEATKAIVELKKNLVEKKQAGDLFGMERSGALDGILGNINQTFGGKELYPSIEEKAAHLLYFAIKDHPFSDGNKRIASFLFIVFLARNKYLFKKNGEKKFNDNALVALALLIAESDPKQKDIIVTLIINFLHT